MTSSGLSKAALHEEQRFLATLRRALPALELKRKRLASAAGDARETVAALEAQLTGVKQRVAAEVPMLGNEEVVVNGLGRLETVEISTENVAGVRIPVLSSFRYTTREYSVFARPHWVDVAASLLERATLLTVQLRIACERLEKLERARLRITQRVNLFDKILIPRSTKQIRRIRVYLGDAERAAVVRAKVAKNKKLRGLL